MAPDATPSTPPDGETDPFTLAAQQRWLDLARLGKDAWNTWAEEELKKPLEERATVDLSGQNIGHGEFDGFVFPGAVDFRRAIFDGHTIFQSATFEGLADFRNATFESHADFERATFKSSVAFFKATFMGDANFLSATFKGNGHFLMATFMGIADFLSATFKGYADFESVTFDRSVQFRSATFKSDAIFINVAFKDSIAFYGVEVTKTLNLSRAHFNESLNARAAQFKGPAFFAHIDFQRPPDFTSSSFAHSPSFLGATFAYPLSDHRFKWLWGICAVEDGHEHYRRLKQLAAEAHDYETELRLFALETKAKRSYVLTFGNPWHLLSLLLNYLYEWFSDFGQSVMRPGIWLGLTFAIALYLFAALAGSLGWPWALPGAVWVAAAVNLLPFAGQAVIGREIMREGLCPAPADAQDWGCLQALYAISAVEGLFALIFLFLIGLGLRNRFRIK